MIRPMYRKKQMPAEQYVRGSMSDPAFTHDNTIYDPEVIRDSYDLVVDDVEVMGWIGQGDGWRGNVDHDVRRDAYEQDGCFVTSWLREVSHVPFAPMALGIERPIYESDCEHGLEH